MSLGLNLHSIARGAISALHPEVPATLYRSVGQTTGEDGAVKSVYAPGVPVSAQIQSESPSALAHADRVGMEETSRKLYLFSEPGLDKRVAGVVRPLARGGDMLQLENGTWWLVVGVIEDFTLSGWACVRATMQVGGPDFSNSEWYTP
ncbi:MAG: hypothetical protein LBP61_01715 [Desulfovibrio sp.]|jgi:hypothetical protein|nr:hypothetical protein [Desulfovibrio sp.]